MKKCFRAVGVVASMLMLGACTHGGGTEVSDAQLATFHDGSTTIADVTSALGRPTSDIQDSSGLRTLGYSAMRTSINGAAFIPIVGPLAASASGHTQTVIFQFDARGILVKHTTMTSQFGS